MIGNFNSAMILLLQVILPVVVYLLTSSILRKIAPDAVATILSAIAATGVIVWSFRYLLGRKPAENEKQKQPRQAIPQPTPEKIIEEKLPEPNSFNEVLAQVEAAHEEKDALILQLQKDLARTKEKLAILSTLTASPPSKEPSGNRPIISDGDFKNILQQVQPNLLAAAKNIELEKFISLGFLGATKEFQRLLLEEMLERCGGDQDAAAARLGLAQDEWQRLRH